MTMEREIKLQDLQLYCRTCLKKHFGDKQSITNMPPAILELFRQATGFEEAQTEIFPQSVCNTCCEIIKSFDDFCKMSIKSKDFLEKLINDYQGKENEIVCPSEKPMENPQSMESNSFEEVFLECIVKEEETELKIQSTADISPLEAAKIENSTARIDCKYGCGKVFKRLKTATAHYRNKHKIKDASPKTNNEKDNCSNTIEKINSKKLDTDDFTEENNEKNNCSNTIEKINSKKLDTDDFTEENISLSHLSKITCKTCQRTFPSERSLKTHMRSHNAKKTSRTKHYLEPDTDKSSMEDLMCKICLNSYSSAATLRVHMRLHKETGRPFKCPQCPRDFNKRARLQRHIEERHAENPVQIPCKYGCGKVFKRLESATGHYYLKHRFSDTDMKAKDNNFVCEDCGKIFKSMASLQEHSYKHRPEQDRPYKCEICNKSFTSKRSYEDHLLRHTGVKNYECPHCGKKKTTKKELTTHINFHTQKKTYTCGLCGKVFNRPENLRLHKRTVHMGIRNYKCRFCSEAFGKADTLKHHEMRHTGERPHKCEICGRGFIQAVALRTHMNTHSK